MYRVTFKCERCGHIFTRDSKQLITAVEKVQEEGCSNCKDTYIEDSSEFVITLVKHDILDEEGEIIQPECWAYGWECTKRDLE